MIGDDGFLRIGDFGLAKEITGAECNTNVVTLIYRPPELILGKNTYGAEIDMWSAGCIFVECMSRRPPFMGPKETDVIADIFRLCGTPADSDAQDWPMYPSVRPAAPAPSRLAELYGVYGLEFVDAVAGMLRYGADARWTAEQALRAAFFTAAPYPFLPWQSPRPPADR